MGMACVWAPDGVKCLLSIVNYQRLHEAILKADSLDESEFLSPFGLRSLSKYHLADPYILTAGGNEWTVRYEPAGGHFFASSAATATGRRPDLVSHRVHVHHCSSESTIVFTARAFPWNVPPAPGR